MLPNKGFSFFKQNMTTTSSNKNYLFISIVNLQQRGRFFEPKWMWLDFGKIQQHPKLLLQLKYIELKYIKYIMS